VTRFETAGLACRVGAELGAFSPEAYLGRANIRPLDRTSQLVAAAAALALEDSGWTPEKRETEELGLVLGTMFCSIHTISEFDRRAVAASPIYASPMNFANTVINAAAGQTAIWHKLRGINSTIASGASSGLQAIAYATQLIAAGQATALLAGGAEELCFESFLAFNRAGLLCGSNHLSGHFPVPFDAGRNGFALGEGAALLMLEEAQSAIKRGARVLAEVRGYGSAYDTSRGTNERRSIDAISRSVGIAVADADMTADEIGCLSASANGSIAWDRREAVGIASILGDRAEDLPVAAIKAMLGETLGASGAIQAVDLTQSMRDGVLPGIRQLERADVDNPLRSITRETAKVEIASGLINSIGFDGNCCSLVLARSECS
jgi:3-oxoacyl-[acyl-carrier-protein] synthase II